MFPTSMAWNGDDEFTVTIQRKSVISRPKKS